MADETIGNEVAKFEVGFDFKALETADDGDLIFEGLAAPITTDDEDEHFEEKALQGAIDEFMAGDRPLLFHHNGNFPLGNVESLELRPGVGLWMKARVMKPEPGTEAAEIFNKIKRGAIRGISGGGRFWRRPVAEGEKAGNPLASKWKIWKSRFREFSITPIPVHPMALGEVAVKAFVDDEEERARVREEEARNALEDAAARYGNAVARLADAVESRIAAHRHGNATELD